MKRICTCLIDQHELSLSDKQLILPDSAGFRIQNITGAPHQLPGHYLTLERVPGPSWSERIMLQAFSNDSSVIMLNGKMLDHGEAIALDTQNTITMAKIAEEKEPGRFLELTLGVEKKYRPEVRAGMLLVLIALLILTLNLLRIIEAYNELLAQSSIHIQEKNYSLAYDYLNAADVEKETVGMLSGLLVNDRKVRDSIEHYLLQDLAEGRCLEDMVEYEQPFVLKGVSEVLTFNCRQEQLVSGMLQDFLKSRPSNMVTYQEYKTQIEQLKKIIDTDPYGHYGFAAHYKAAEYHLHLLEILSEGMKKYTVAGQGAGKLNALKALVAQYDKIRYQLPALLKNRDPDIRYHFKTLLQQCRQDFSSQRELIIASEIERLLNLQK